MADVENMDITEDELFEIEDLKKRVSNTKARLNTAQQAEQQTKVINVSFKMLCKMLHKMDLIEKLVEKNEQQSERICE